MESSISAVLLAISSLEKWGEVIVFRNVCTSDPLRSLKNISHFMIFNNRGKCFNLLYTL